MSSYVHQRQKLSSVTKNLAAVAMGFLPADLLIRNGKLVNVNVGYIQENIDVAVKDGFIAFVGEGSHIKTDEHTRIVDATNKCSSAYENQLKQMNKISCTRLH